jgi:hypothetical protein
MSVYAERTTRGTYLCSWAIAAFTVLASLVGLCSEDAWGQATYRTVYTFKGDSVGDRLGEAVSGAGDVNGDGHADLIIGAPYDDNNGEDSGSARIFSGANGAILYTFNGDSAGDLFGLSVSNAGDVNRDGYADLVVGALGDDINGVDSGSARVFSGADGALLYSFSGDSAGDQFGRSVSGAGDVNGDGYPDIIVGADTDDSNGADSGSARIFSGATGAILYTFNGDSAGDSFGLSVSGAGDVNRDGYADVIVGAAHADNNGESSGMARVFSGADGAILHTFNGDSAGDQFGISVSGAGDINRDGSADLIVGAWRSDLNAYDSGSARVFSGANGATLHSFGGDGASHRFGFSVSDAGDMDNDGYSDLLVGAPMDSSKGYKFGSARVFSGRDGTIIHVLRGEFQYAHFGNSVSSAGDVNGDGYPDIIVGALSDDSQVLFFGSAQVFVDECPDDIDETSAGQCGCGIAETDTDNDGTADCKDSCPSDATKVAVGQCGCGVADADSDKDGIADCNDQCSLDAGKLEPGQCGCGVADTDTDNDGTVDCKDGCASDAKKITAGTCGCGVADTDSDNDGTADCNDPCSLDAGKLELGQCGCGVADTDTDNDGTVDCKDSCSSDATKITAGQCGCGVADTDSDKDGIADCNDQCSLDAGKLEPGQCGCGVADNDTDNDGTPDCNDKCPTDHLRINNCSSFNNEGLPTPTPTPTATPTVKLLDAPSIRVSRNSAQVWVERKFASKDRVTFSVAGPKKAVVNGRRLKGATKGITRFQASFSNLPKGTYRAAWQVLWSGTNLQKSTVKTFRIK